MFRRRVPSVLLALACALVIGAAAPVAGALTRDAQLKQNVRLLQVYVERYAAGKGFTYPAASVVRRGGGLTAPVWPANPWTGRPMAPGTARGAYTYTLAAGGASYTLTAHLASGAFTVTGAAPSWLAAERAATAADLNDARAATAAAQADAAAAKRERESAVAELETAQSALDLKNAQLATTNTQLSITQGQLSTTQGELATAQAASATAEQARDAALADTTAARQERDAALANAADARQARDAALAELATAQTALEAKKAELATAQAQLDAGQTALAAAQADLATSQADLATSQAQLAAAKADLATAQAALSTAQTDLAVTRDRAAELGARVIKGYVEQWGMLYNATSPTAADVGKTGAVGAMFSYWPDNPFTGQPMTSGGGSGDYVYTQGPDGTSYTMSAGLATRSVSLDGAVPQQLRNALDNARSQTADQNVRVIQAAIDRYAMDNNGVFPAKGQVDSTSLGAYVDLWPRNPWTNAAMVDSSAQGDFTYVSTQYGYTLTSRLKGGVAGDTVDNCYADHFMSVRDHLKNVYCQAAVQVVREYVEEWKTANGGTPPTAEQLTKTGAVGSAHAWWPVNPWYGSPMTNEDVKGAFQYAPGAGGSYTLTVRQQPDAYYTQYYEAL